MALMIHLPLNGNVINHGLLGDDIITKTVTPTFTDSGKLGKALSGGTLTLQASATDQVFNNEEITIAFWIYPNVATGGSGGIIFGKENMTGPDNRKFTIFQYPTANDLHWSWQNDGNTTFIGGSKSGVLPSYTWTHVCFTYKNPTGILYVNGVETTIFTGVSDSATFAYNTNIIVNNTSRYINDLRVYNHCLNAKEVDLISKGLVVHYPLNDPYSTLSVNKYSGDYFEGLASSKGTFTVAKLADERGYNYKLSYTGTGSSSWHTFSFPAVSFTAGKSYTFSCKVRKRSASSSLSLRAARIGNDWTATQVNVLSATDTEWHEFHVTATMTETFERSGTTYNVSPRIEFYTPSLSTSGTVYTYDFDLKDMMISECDSTLAATNGAWNDGVVYDTSGYGNHGSVATNTSPVINSSTPRYDACNKFESKHYITGKSPWSAQKISELSVSAWIYQESGGGYSTWLACNGYGSPGLWFGVNAEGCGQWAYCGSNSPSYVKGTKTVNKDSWYLHTYTFKNGVAKWYLNGELTATTTYTNNYLSLANNFTLADSYSGSSWNTSFAGSISDFRLYATELTADDILNMYTTAATLTDKGSLLLRGEIVE